MKIFISGGTGFIGTYLAQNFLAQGHSIFATGTSPSHPFSGRENFHYIKADTSEKGEWQEKVKEANVIINLAGRTIFKFWTEKYKARMYESRILTTRNIVDALPQNAEALFLSASAIGYYGDRGDDVLKENTAAGNDFLARVCVDWEKEALKAKEKGARVCVMRLGVVLGKEGGALAKMTPAFRMGAGGPIGSGKHWFPWIHMDDLASALEALIENEDLYGAFNFVAPNTVTNNEFAKALGKALKRPSFIRAPAFVIKTVMGEMGRAFLHSQRAVPEKLLKNNFNFTYSRLEEALSNLLS
jgi:uncharacterized protein (TIGR01777 family)